MRPNEVTGVAIANGRRAEGFPPPAGDDGEARVLSLLASGRLADALARLDAGGIAAPFAALARADVRVRTYRATGPELQDLCAAEERAPGRDPALLWWARALLAESLVLELDPAAVAVADRTLAAIPTDDVLPLTALSARARLRRVASSRVLLTPGPGVAEASRQAQRDAIGDFIRCGHADEALLSEVTEAAWQVTYLGLDPTGPLERIVDCRLLLDDPRSLWPRYVDHLICVIAGLVGDGNTVLEARERLAARPEADADLGPWPTMSELAVHLVGSVDTDALAAFDATLHRFDRRFIRFLAGLMLVLAHRMADAGHPDASRRARFALCAAGLGTTEEGDLELHRLRFAIAAGTVPPVDEILAELGRLDAAGRPESAASFAARLADELAGLAAYEEAAAVRAWNTRPPGRPVAERATVAIPPDPAPADPGSLGPAATTVRIDVLSPMLVATAGGEEVRFGRAAALLVVHLVVGDGPLHVEQVGELVWPGAGLPVVRRRLNSLVHRLRHQQPGIGRLVRRSGDLVLLDRYRCRLDLALFDAATGPEDTVEALCSVRGNLCHVQFPYDERLIEARHRFAARWTRRAAEAVARDPALRPRLAVAAAALELDPTLTDP